MKSEDFYKSSTPQDVKTRKQAQNQRSSKNSKNGDSPTLWEFGNGATPSKKLKTVTSSSSSPSLALISSTEDFTWTKSLSPGIKLEDMVVKTDGEVKAFHNSITPLSPNSQSTTRDDLLCDDILSCISALDEVIAEFDDSMSQSSSSSSFTSVSEAVGNQTIQQSPHHSHHEDNLLHQFNQSKEPKKFPAEKLYSRISKDPVGKDRTNNSAGVRSSLTKIGSMESKMVPSGHSMTTIPPVKPIRQSKKLTNQNHSKSTSESIQYEIETHHYQGISTNGNYMSYGIVFPKESSPNSRSPNNNNCSLIGYPSPTNGNSEPIDTDAKIRQGRQSISPTRTQLNQPKSPTTNQSIPITFIVKPEQLERYLEPEDVEDENWNYHIEKNLPRSLRKTRKTCFVDDDDEEQEKYCRSPKDFRRNLIVSDPKRSPLPQQRVIKKYEDGFMGIIPDGNKNCGLSPSILQSSNHSSPSAFQFPPRGASHGIRQPESPPITSVLDIGQDVDDGYLSMVNRHETPPILWPETEMTLGLPAIPPPPSLDFEKRLTTPLTSNIPHLQRKLGRTGLLVTEDKTDYFSDDSLEFEGDGNKEVWHPPPKSLRSEEKTSSFILAAAPHAPIIVQPYINKSASRKSWSPASEIRIPGKTVINSSTWRKGACPGPGFNFDETSTQIMIPKLSPVRKPCAFFIPMNSSHQSSSPSPQASIDNLKTTQSLVESSQQNNTAMSHQSLVSIAMEVTDRALETGIHEAACINSLIDSVLQDETVQTAMKESGFISDTMESPIIDTLQLPSSSLTQSNSIKSTSVSSSSVPLSSGRRDGTECSSLSSGIEYETSSDGLIEETHFDSLNPEPVFTPISSSGHLTSPKHFFPSSNQNLKSVTQVTTGDIEDLYENPPSFIPPPPQSESTPCSSLAERLSPTTNPNMVKTLINGDNNLTSYSLSLETEDKDKFLQSVPTRTPTPGEWALRTQRQTSRSHENLLDITRKDLVLHPHVRRGQSATLPSNAVQPTSTRRPSAFRQFFGFFRRNKKQSTTSVISVTEIPVVTPRLQSSRNIKESNDSPISQHNRCHHQEDSNGEIPNHPNNSPILTKSNRPSVSESNGSQRSNNSKTSGKRSVLSRIFRRKDK